MEIQLISTRQNDTDQSIRFTLTDGDATAYAWRCDAPKDADPQAYCEANKEKFLYLILGKMYPGAPKHESLEERRQWIADGAWLGEGEDAYQVERQPWPYSHPAIIPASEAEKASMVEDMAAMIADMGYSDVAQTVENLFGNLSTGQKTYLKRIGQAVIYLLRQ